MDFLNSTLQQHHANNTQRTKRNMIGQYKLKKRLGEGSFGCVYQAKHVLTKLKVAIKLLAIRDTKHRQSVIREVAVLRHLHSDQEDYHIVQLLDVIDLLPEDCPIPLSMFPGADESSVHTITCIVMEYIKGDDLLNHVQQRTRLREEEAAKLFHQLIIAIDWCHTRNVIHRDIKLENLMVESKTCLKLIDFGLSQFVEPHTTLRSFVGSIAYSSPEVIQGDNYDGKLADLWSCGVVLYTMVTGEFPWDGLDTKDQVRNILKGRWILPNVSAECYQLIKAMLKVDPTKRATISEILNHPWMLKYISRENKRLSAERVAAVGKQELTPSSSLEAPRKVSFAGKLFRKKETSSNTIVECTPRNT